MSDRDSTPRATSPIANLRGKRGRGGAPKGNRNRLTHGFYAQRMRAEHKKIYGQALRIIRRSTNAEAIIEEQAALVWTIVACALAANPDLLTNDAACAGVERQVTRLVYMLTERDKLR